jgi:hypothetical protein
MANHKTHYGVRVRSTRSTLYFYYEQRIAHTEIFRLLCLSLALYIVSAIRVVSAVVSIAIARARILSDAYSSNPAFSDCSPPALPLVDLAQTSRV